MAESAEVEAAAVSVGPLAFEDFFEREYANLARALLLLTGERAEAEDLAQEALARVFERWDRVAAMESPSGYLYRTALNLNRKRLRRQGVRRRHRTESRPEPAPEDVAETRDAILRALRSLPPAQREALVLVEWLGLEAEEAGAVLGIAAASVRGRLHRARQSLRARFGGPDA
ncbi:MAG TPA: sigma-70 family RNA polymerase sigma factor [Actinomycetota bacterium]|nr:sigma-70 family RNA polymerase sigma factor [Actinomycetota bacterium]